MKLRFFRKKSQAAMEFLMTYGWAILVVLAAIAALAYFGVLSPDRFLPEKCVLTPGITCISSRVETDKVAFIIANGKGQSISISNIAVTKDGGTTCNTAFETPVPIKNGEDFVFDTGTPDYSVTGCDNGEEQDKFIGDVAITYELVSPGSDSSLSKTAYGSLTGKVEAGVAAP
tara:strand:+ start:8305 stop:8823 length:519 start_codon:yes stop_codon:yes gene_type:complete